MLCFLFELRGLELYVFVYGQCECYVMQMLCLVYITGSLIMGIS